MSIDSSKSNDMGSRSHGFWHTAVTVGPVGQVLMLGSVGALSLALAWLLAASRGKPLPAVHDEFSYLLAADTYALGRVTNAAHPLAEHFESMHILVRPSYMSKYPPGQGLILALGQVVVGDPIWGVWLTTAGAAMAVCWALGAFLPRPWAFLGAVLLTIHPQILLWSQRYWGGNLAVLGGALLLGGFARLTRHTTKPRSPSLLLAIGLVILANTRPYEGLLLAVAIGVCWVIGTLRRSYPRFTVPLRVVAPTLTAVLAPTALAMGYLNWRVTGQALCLPYIEHERQYAVAPSFLFMRMSEPPAYQHLERAKFHIEWERRWHNFDTHWHQISKVNRSALQLYEGSLGLGGTAVGMIAWRLRKNRRVRFLLGVAIAFAAGLLVETFFFPHYAAPAAGVLAALATIALRRVDRLTRPVGVWLVTLLILFYVGCSICWYSDFAGRLQRGLPVWRQHIMAKLGSLPGKHLIVVRYSGSHDVHEEWVYNAADIDAAKIVWAHEMDRERNARLLEYFHDRTAWLFEPDANPTAVKPYDMIWREGGM